MKNGQAVTAVKSRKDQRTTKSKLYLYTKPKINKRLNISYIIHMYMTMHYIYDHKNTLHTHNYKHTHTIIRKFPPMVVYKDILIHLKVP